MDVVGEAARRYTPREPHSYITNKGEIKYSCPNCCNEEKRIEPDLHKGQKYCSKCGQAIEWR